MDLDAFFCAVEELQRPDLIGKPFAVGGSPDGRGVVSSCSYAARMFGVHSAMPMRRALQICPDLQTVSGHHRSYSDYSKKVMAILSQSTFLVEQISIDEAFLDISDLPETSSEVARNLQKQILDELNLPNSFGGATNKLVAKIANNIGKKEIKSNKPPCAIKIIPPGGEAAFLAPLKCDELWGVGPKTALRLKQKGIKTIGDIAAIPDTLLVQWFGKLGGDLARRSKGIDSREISLSSEMKSISAEITFEKDITDFTELRMKIWRLSEKVGARLRKKNFSASTVRLKLRWADFTTPTRQVSFQQPIDQDKVIFEAALQLFNTLWEKGKPVRLIGVGVSGLAPQAVQLSLWDTPDEKERRLDDALDELRLRYGKNSVKRGVNIGEQDHFRS